jgi:hypothetical protein
MKPHLIWPPDAASHPIPVVEITSKPHVSPSAPVFQLAGNCKAYNASYNVKFCHWKQIYPLPTSPENTVLPGGSKDCPPTSDEQDVDATIYGLKVPTHLDIYIFELACGHTTGHLATKQVKIWVGELTPPIVGVANPKVTVSTSTGSAKLDVSCIAIQGTIVERKWTYLEGPTTVTPSENGVVQVSLPGVYKFKHRCTDSFGGTALRYFEFRIQ